MNIKVQTTINGSKDQVWRIITDIENSINTITGIEKIEVLERPPSGLVGLKWRETRTLFGQTATEVMWITKAKENEFYRTRAESHGAVYTSTLIISEAENKTLLTMEFGSVAQTFRTKLLSAITGPFFKKATKDALMKDLKDIKAAVEASSQ